MQTVSNLIKQLQQIVKDNPKAKNFPVIYSVDDEGNEYNKVFNKVMLTQVHDINKDMYLEVVGFWGDKSINFKDCNCVIIN